MQKITPFLWFDDKAEEAAKFYVSIFPNSKVLDVTRYGDAGPGPKGTVMTARFELNGQEFTALNGGPLFKFTEAVSFVVNCETQKEVDYFCTFLKPFFNFTEVMSGSNYPTLGTLLLLLDHLSDHIITTIQKTKIPWVKEIAQEMNTKFKSVLEHLYNSSAYLALILDPRYKSQILPDSIDEDTIKQILVEEFNNYQILERSYNSENDDDGSVVGDKRKSIGLLDYMLQKKKKSSNLQSRNEVDEYLIIPVEPSNINPCEW